METVAVKKVREVLVSAKSRVQATAGAIAGIIREGDEVVVRAIGAGAVNQAVKAIAVARKYLSEENCDIASFPDFGETEIGGERKTVILIFVREVKDEC